jgi:hypothetical protein
LNVDVYFDEALKNAPQAEHLYRPTFTGFLPFGASVQLFSGFVTSVPHFVHFAMITSPQNYSFNLEAQFKRIALW